MWLSICRFPRFFGLILMVLLCGVVLPSTAKARSVIPAEPGVITSEVTCQGEQLKIKCPNHSYALEIHGGSYGRTQNGDTVCPYPGSQNDFYYNCGERDVKEKLLELCEKRKKCMFKVGKALFGDPCQGHAYLTMIYSCEKRKGRKNRRKTTLPPPTSLLSSKAAIRVSLTRPDLSSKSATIVPLIPDSSSTASTTKTNISQNSSAILTTGSPTLNATNLTDVVNVNILFKKGPRPTGILMSLIVWVVFVKGRPQLFTKVFLTTIGSATLLALLGYAVLILVKRKRRKKRESRSTNNIEEQLQKLNPSTTLNGDVKKNCELDTKSFPAPISALPPPPDDMIYPSPSPELMNSARPPPPPPQRGNSLDDISKIGKERNKNVELTRSMSMRTRPPDYYAKDLNFANHTNMKLEPIVGCPDIHAVLRPKEAIMYMNPMYGNGHTKERPC